MAKQPAVTQNPELFGMFDDELCKNAELRKGLSNLAELPSLGQVEKKPIKHKVFEKGCMGFRRQSQFISVAIACGKAQVRNIDIRKYVALVEKMKDDTHHTIMLQNFSDAEEGRAARGQVLARLDPIHSAIVVVQGLTGRVIRSDSDVVRYDVYYLDRDQLAAFYLACKFQLRGADQLETMIATYSGWVEYDISLCLCDDAGSSDENA